MLTRDVEIGGPVSSILNMGSAASLVTVGDIERVFVRGKVDEADVGRVKLGQPARISVETFKDRSFEGKARISPIGVERANVTTRGRGVDRQPGQRAQGEHDGQRRDRARGAPERVIVPEAAIVYDARKNPFVEVPDAAAQNGRRRVAVKLGVGSGTRTEIVSGVQAGDRVLLPR